MSKKYSVVSIYSNFLLQDRRTFLCDFIVDNRELKGKEQYCINKILDLFLNEVITIKNITMYTNEKRSTLCSEAEELLEKYLGIENNVRVYKLENKASKEGRAFNLQMYAVINNISISKSLESDSLIFQKNIKDTNEKDEELSQAVRLQKLLPLTDKSLFIIKEITNISGFPYDLNSSIQGSHTLKGLIKILPDFFELRMCSYELLCNVDNIYDYLDYNDIPSISFLIKKGMRNPDYITTYSLFRSNPTFAVSGIITKCPIISLLDM